MALYSYKAKNLNGEEIAGSAEAVNERQLSQGLRKQGYFLLNSQINDSQPQNKGSQEKGQEEKGQEENMAGVRKLNFFGVPLTEKLFFTRNLEVMVKTGVSLVRSFGILSLQTNISPLLKIKKSL